MFTPKYGRSVHLDPATRLRRRGHCENQICKKTADKNLDLGPPPSASADLGMPVQERPGYLCGFSRVGAPAWRL